MKLRNLFKRESPPVSEAQALQIAQQVCQDRGWSWFEPISIRLTWRDWVIHTNIEARGINAHIVVDQHTGSFLQAHYLPR